MVSATGGSIRGRWRRPFAPAIAVAVAAIAAAAPAASAEGTRPSPTSAPWIGGDALVGGTSMVAGNGTWDDGGSTPEFSFRWQRCDAAGEGCADIPAALGERYDPTAADLGATLRFAVTATNSHGSATAVSELSGVIEEALPPSSAGPIEVWGEAVEGQVVNPGDSSWGGRAGTVELRYRWLRCDAAAGGCAELPAASGYTYALTAADVGSRLRVRVTATNARGHDTVTSEPTAVVAGDGQKDPVEPATVPLAGGDVGGAAGDDPAGPCANGCPVAPTVAKLVLLGIPRRIDRGALRKGVTFTVVPDQPVAVAATLRAGRRVLARRTLPRAGGARRITLGGRTRSRRLRLTVVAVNAGGYATRATRTILLR